MATNDNRAEFEALLQAQRQNIWTYLRVLGCSPEHADDLVQETLVSVLEKPFEHRNEYQSAAYLRTRARFLFLNRARRDRRYEQLGDYADAVDEVWEDYTNDGGLEPYLAALDTCLSALDQRQRKALELRYQTGATPAGVAAKLALTDEALKSLLRRAKEFLRICIARRIGE